MATQPSKPQSGSKPQNSALEKLRINKAFWLSIIGLVLAALIVLILLAFGLRGSTEIVAVVGVFTSVLGTLVGAFLGVQVGSAGKAQAEERADENQKKTVAFAAAADKGMITEAKRLYGKDLFK